MKKIPLTQQRRFNILQSVLIFCLIGLVLAMMLQIQHLTGTARVINYAGLVRGATQRLVKLEIAEQPNDDLIQTLDDILSGLESANGNYDLTRLNDVDYLTKLNIQANEWKHLKEEIALVRENGYQNTDILPESEYYFQLADETVAAAETYSEHVAQTIRHVEELSILVMAGLVILIVRQSVSAVRIAQNNRVLAQKAYIDIHTGLPNKSRCEELLQNSHFITEPTCCLVFDLNNLKFVNDSLGHSAGDLLILNFSRILRQSVPAKDFVGRFGGDEFMVVLWQSHKEQVDQVLHQLQEEIDHFNSIGNHTPLSYACGYSLSTDYEECSLHTLFDKADQWMYRNKLQQKQGRTEGEPAQTPPESKESPDK